MRIELKQWATWIGTGLLIVGVCGSNILMLFEASKQRKQMKYAYSFVQWEHTFGVDASATTLLPYPNGGYVAAGYEGGEKKTSPGAWLLALTSQGKQLWHHPFYIGELNIPLTIAFSHDLQEILVAGVGHQENWIYAVNRQGQFLWEQRLEYRVQALHSTKNATYIGAGSDYIFELNRHGQLLWSRTITEIVGEDQQNTHGVTAFQPTLDGSYIAVGRTLHDQAWVLKVNAQREMLWYRTFGGEKTDNLHTVIPLTDGTYFAAGETNSGTKGWGDSNFDAWFLKLSNDGHLLWEQTLPDAPFNYIQSAQPIPDGGYLVVGSDDAGRASDLWLGKLLPTTGMIQWYYRFGSYGDDYAAHSVHKAFNSGYVLAGNHGNRAWVFQINPGINGK